SQDDIARAAQLAQEGWTLWQQRQYAQAEARFAAAIGLDPKLANAWNGLGWSLFNQGQGDNAKPAFEEVIRLEPGHAAAENGLGWIAFNASDMTGAEKHWTVAANANGTAAF